MVECYKTRFKGEINLKSLKAEASHKIIKMIENLQLNRICSYDATAQTIYINGAFDNSAEVMERFILKLMPLVDIPNNRPIKAQGERVNDRYDLVIQEEGLYIQMYELKKTEMVLYQP